MAKLKRCNPGDRHMLQFISDAALMFKGLQHTFMAIKLPHLSGFPNSPWSCREFCGFEGSDKWEDYHERAQDSIKEMNAFIDGGGFQVMPDGVQFMFDVVAGGDQANSHAFNALGSCNAPYPCLYCEGTRDNINNQNIPDAGLRTRGDINILAHTAQGYCRGCDKVLGEGDMAKWGESPPGNSTAWGLKHFSVEYGKSCLLHIEICDWVICILHANLCITKFLWETTILPLIDLVPAKKGAELQSTVLQAVLKKGGVVVKEARLKKQSKNVSQNIALDSLRAHSFHGRDAQNLSVCIPRVIAVLLPPNHTNKDVREANVALNLVWKSWENVWTHLNTYFVDDGLGSQSRADNARAYTTLYDTFLGLVRGKYRVKQGLYIHILRCHTHTQILKFGCLAPYQVQGLEHCNKIRKEIMHKQTNHMVQQTTVVPAESAGVVRNVGKSRIQQVTEVVLMKSLVTPVAWKRKAQGRTDAAAQRRHAAKKVKTEKYMTDTASELQKVIEGEEGEGDAVG
jgi:hypothetical protein